MFGLFHIIALISCCLAAYVSARLLRTPNKKRLMRILFTAGLILAALEAVKQLYIYIAINHGTYDWWYFPFQLCSVPIYLCILLPITRGRLRAAFLSFMATYTFISAAAALIFPEDFLRAGAPLVFHGFLWHGILLFISLIIIFSKAADMTATGFKRATLLFLALCIAALCINIATEPLMASSSGIEHTYACMFYLNPYHISPQPIVSTIQKSTGIAFGLVLYVLSIIAAAGAFRLYIISSRAARERVS